MIVEVIRAFTGEDESLLRNEVEKLLNDGANIEETDEYGWTPLTMAAGKSYFDVLELLIEKGADINVCRQFSDEPLGEAVKSGDKKMALFLLDHGADINANKGGLAYTALHTAIEHNRKELIKILLERDADIELQEDNGKSPLMLACEDGKTEYAEILIKNGADINAHGNDFDYRWTPLIFAAYRGKIDVISLLLDHGVNVDARYADGKTALEWATEQNQEEAVKLLKSPSTYNMAEYQQKTKIAADKNALLTTLKNYRFAEDKDEKELYNTVKSLIESGADINAVCDVYGDTPLMLAAETAPLNVVTALVEHGATVNVKNNYGYTPLINAARTGYEKDAIKIVQYLLEQGASVDELHMSNKTAFLFAAEYGYKEIAQLLLKHGANINAVADGEKNGLMLAGESGNADIVKMFLEEGFDPNCQDGDGNTPILLVSEKNYDKHLNVIKILMEKGARINVQNTGGETPLSLALKKRNKKIIKYLIDSGADINTKNTWGKTPLMEAVSNNDKNAVKLLIELGADINAKDDTYLQTALMNSALYNYEEVAVLLITSGANLNTVDNRGNTALIYACQQSPKTALLLIDKKADIHIMSKKGQSALRAAVSRSNKQLINILLEKGAHINDGDVLTGVYSEEILEMLIEKGISLDTLDTMGLNAYMVAVLEGNKKIADLLETKGCSWIRNSTQITLILSTLQNSLENLVKGFCVFLDDEMSELFKCHSLSSLHFPPFLSV